MEFFSKKLSGLGKFFKKEESKLTLLEHLDSFAVGRIIKYLPKEAKHQSTSPEDEWVISEYDSKTGLVTLFKRNMPENIQYQDEILLDRLKELNINELNTNSVQFDLRIVNQNQSEFDIKTVKSFDQLFELLKKAERIINHSGVIYPADYLIKIIQDLIDHTYKNKLEFESLIRMVTNTLNLRKTVRLLFEQRNIDFDKRFQTLDKSKD